MEGDYIIVLVYLDHSVPIYLSIWFSILYLIFDLVIGFVRINHQMTFFLTKRTNPIPSTVLNFLNDWI